MGDPVSGEIRFSSYCQPPLTAPTYKVVVQQTVTQLQPEPFAAPDFEFAVAGPRFALNPADIYSVYPPEGSTGDFARSLPHVVLTRRTIPWERKMAPDSPVCRPWMALLLLSAEGGNEGTGIPKSEPRKVSDLFDQVPPGVKLPPGVAGPKLACEKYELDDPCNTIDLDAQLFRRVAPRAADLDYLAHVREVNTDNKETVSFLTDGSFSVVIGNRFPKAPGSEGPVENRAILVSLEGMHDFLPGQPKHTAKTLRLAVLASWTFYCEKARDFKKSMVDLGNPLRPLRLKLAEDVTPEDAPETVKYVLPRDDANEAVTYVRAAFSRGYTALNHHTRLGEKTVSWYRGPLTPLDMEVAGRYEFKAVPDALVRYDHTRGLMDLTYAGASQLGRLLGLQDRSFAQALSEWRTDVQRQIKARLEKEELRRILRSQPAEERLLQSPESEFLESALADAMKGDRAEGEYQPGPSFDSTLAAKAKPDAKAEKAGAVDGGQQWRAATMDELPATVRDWLARRVLLYGVPFLYLVPDERMLPLPSMRFFRIDPLWIKRLLEGACSVGRNSTEAELVDSILGDEFFKIAVNGSAKVRQRPLSDEGDGRKNADDSPSPTFPFEGFLLRSPIVRGWQGLEMKAWYRKERGKDPVPAPPLRIDRLAPDIMLCIFNGPLTEIEIRQPPEGMHFGADGFQKTSLRNVTRPPLHVPAKDPGKQIDLNKLDPPAKVEIPFRRDRDKDLRVVNVRKLATHLHAALTNNGGMDKNAPFASFTSAEFAVQMTESPGRAKITVGK